MSALYHSYEETLDFPSSHKICLWPKGVSLTGPKVICGNSRSLFKATIISVYVIFCNGKLIEANIWHKDCFWPVNMSWPWALVIFSSRSLYKKWCIHCFPIEKLSFLAGFIIHEIAHRTSSFKLCAMIRLLIKK